MTTDTTKTDDQLTREKELSRERVTVRIDVPLRERVEKMAAADGQSLSKIVRALLTKYVEEGQPQ